MVKQAITSDLLNFDNPGINTSKGPNFMDELLNYVDLQKPVPAWSVQSEVLYTKLICYHVVLFFIPVQFLYVKFWGVRAVRFSGQKKLKREGNERKDEDGVGKKATSLEKKKSF